MMQTRLGRFVALPIMAAATLFLTGCLVSPGKFDSTLVLRQDGTFSLSYEGEIFFIGLSQLAAMGDGSADDFAPECYDDDTFDTRECTPAEIQEQRAEYDANAERRAAREKKNAEEMAAFMGGIDPSDPEAAEELAKVLRRQRGWNNVVHKGDGVFDVSYAIEGYLSHDITFPVIEKFVVPTPFIQVILRDEGQVRIAAPGFTAQEGGNGMPGMMGGMGSMGALAQMSAGDGDEAMTVPELDGTFTIITDGTILANNTDEGPRTDDNGIQGLTWDVTPRSNAAPTALIRMNR